MVKYGECVIRCTECGKGCEAKTQIQRNAGWDNSIVTQTCPHGNMSIDMYTCNSFVPWGEPDSVKFRVRFIFSASSGYKGTFTKEFSMTGTNVGDDKASSNCASAEAHFAGNGFLDFFSNALGIGVIGVFVGQFYETRQLGIAGNLPPDTKAAEKLVAEKKARDEAAEKKARDEAAEKKARDEAAEKKARDEAAAKLAAEKKARDEAAAKLATEKLAAEKLAIEKLAAEKKAHDEAVAKLAAEKKARDEAAAKLAAEKLAAEKLAIEKLAAEKKAEKQLEKEQTATSEIEKQTMKAQETERNVVEKNAALNSALKTGSRWRLLAETYAADELAGKTVNRWKKIAEALRINEQGLKLYRAGKLKEAAQEIESAVAMYEEAACKFTEATMQQPLDTFFNSFIMVIDAFIENEAYEEAQKTIDFAKSHFLDKSDAFRQAERMIENGSWSPNYRQEFLVQLDEQLLQKNVTELADGGEYRD